MVLVGVVVAGIAPWVAAPFVGMARHGTLDQQRSAAWRAEPARSPRPDTTTAVPAQRSAEKTAEKTADETSRESEPLSA